MVIDRVEAGRIWLEGMDGSELGRPHYRPSLAANRDLKAVVSALRIACRAG